MQLLPPPPLVRATPPSGVTATQHAAAHMTPESRALLPDAFLDARVGLGTLAESLNDQIRFRVLQTGAVRDWRIVPDSPNAVALMQTEAGPALLRQLRVAVDSTGAFGAKSTLQGFILAEDDDSLHAASLLSNIDAPEGPARFGSVPAGDVGAATRAFGRYALDLEARATVGARNAGGWITFFPPTARGMLTAAGAYRPGPGDEPQLSSPSMAKYISGNQAHEVQHSITPRTASVAEEARWIEEGTANVLARTPVFQARNARAAGLTPERYAQRLASEPSFDPGWKPYGRPNLPAAAAEKHDAMVSRRYGDSQVVLRDLVRLAGADFRSKAGQAKVAELLQAKSMKFTPGVLAKAIIAEHGLEPKVYDRLRSRIQVAVDLPDGVQGIAREFGIA
ncbi:MAG: hypothetical protein JWM90_1997 [Thermoleophilia bacterium]|nr:hypothetical protein [Thermoleophilia bacterium]